MPNSYSEDIEEKRIITSLQEDHQTFTKASELEIAKAEMGEVTEENERLKTALQHMKNDYQSLQLRYFDIIKQDQESHDPQNLNNNVTQQHDQQQNSCQDHDEAELVSLCLGRSTTPRSDPEANYKISASIENNNNNNNNNNSDDRRDLKGNELSLGMLGCETSNGCDESGENSSEDQVKEVPRKSTRGHSDEASQDQSQAAKRARVSVRARCDTPTMNDGCQWRKYGQKIAKGNPCPRAYYRCTVAPSCPVRKQVQRCAVDMSILITTYEGAHNHPLPVTATEMASTTSAAASMLLSGSSSSSPDQTTSRFTPITSTSGNGLYNFGHFDTTQNNNNNVMRPNHFHFPRNNPSSPFSPLFPTITLDLTSSPMISQPSSSSSSSSSQFINRTMSRIPSSSLSFSNSSETSNTNINSNLSSLWANGSSYFGNNIGSLNLGRQSQSQSRSQEFLYQRCVEKLMSTSSNASNPLQDSLIETLTKAITADSGTFKSVIAAAISSMVGGGGGGGTEQSHHGKSNAGVVERLSQRLTLGHEASLTQNGKGLASPTSFFNGLSSSNF